MKKKHSALSNQRKKQSAFSIQQSGKRKRSAISEKSSRKGAASATPKKALKKRGASAPARWNPIDPNRVAEILTRLDATYPGATCALHHSNAWELLVATILSAQCTDVRVNMVTPELFARF